MRRKRWMGQWGRKKKAKHVPQHKRTAIIDEDLLGEYRACRTCWWCGETIIGSAHAHHLFGRGMGGWSRFDIRENLAALCPSCHGAHHDGNRPLTIDLLAVVAARLKTTQEAIRDKINCLRWERGDGDGQVGTRNGGLVHQHQRDDVPAPLDREPRGDRPSGVEADEVDERWEEF